MLIIIDYEIKSNMVLFMTHKLSLVKKFSFAIEFCSHRILEDSCTWFKFSVILIRNRKQLCFILSICLQTFESGLKKAAYCLEKTIWNLLRRIYIKLLHLSFYHTILSNTKNMLYLSPQQLLTTHATFQRIGKRGKIKMYTEDIPYRRE